ncbi:MAG: MerR family transcriptional regulator [Thermoguttaceae bacterium]|nr:MerR family transcriptional regulator [Thermoguttaceae bacterium]
MLKNDEELLSIGTFLHLCSTTYETLYHYEEIGLLKPTFVKPNGRRYYSFSLFYIYIVITTLKEAGCSLQEIKSFLRCEDLADNFEFLNKKRDDLDVELRRVQRTQEGINDAMKTIKQAIHGKYNLPRLIECPEEYLVTEPYRFSTDDLPSTAELNRNMRESVMNFREDCERLRDAERYLPGAIFLQETLERGNLYESYIFRRRKSQSVDEHLWIKPAGTCLSLVFEGAIRGDVNKNLAMLLKYLKTHSLEMTGPTYLWILTFRYKDETLNNFVFELQIPVRTTP